MSQSIDIIDGLKIHNNVLSDGVPRAATCSDGSKIMMYLDNGIVRSVPEDNWSQVESDLVTRATARASRQAKIASLRTRIRNPIQNIVGIDIDSLTNPQLLLLIRPMAHKIGAVDDDGKIKPYDEWREL